MSRTSRATDISSGASGLPPPEYSSNTVYPRLNPKLAPTLPLVVYARQSCPLSVRISEMKGVPGGRPSLLVLALWVCGYRPVSRVAVAGRVHEDEA